MRTLSATGSGDISYDEAEGWILAFPFKLLQLVKITNNWHRAKSCNLGMFLLLVNTTITCISWADSVQLIPCC